MKTILQLDEIFSIIVQMYYYYKTKTRRDSSKHRVIKLTINITINHRNF